jgi:Spy/CpxP family protein refolding chaperone
MAGIALAVAGGTAADLARGTVAVASAQSTGGPPAQRGQRFGQMLLTLNLSDDQKAKIRAIIQTARDQNKNVTDRDTRRANMHAAFAKVQTVLTPGQQKKLQAEMQAAKAQRDAAAHS